jgi:hypothetical protein
MSAPATIAGPPASLPALPLHDLRGEISPPLALIGRERARLDRLVALARRSYGAPLVAVADRVSRRWLARNTTPYHDEIVALAERMNVRGAYFLNVSFEWSCTCGIAPAPDGEGMCLLRVLDWPLPGLGRELVAVRQSGPAGDFLSLTWPGFIGAVTALAPGRFAAALNQAPVPRHGMGFHGDWAVERLAVWKSREPPPMHLLRQVLENCGSYGEARHALTHSPISVPALYSLAGPRPGEGCVIERERAAARIHEAPVAAANHWLSDDLSGHARGRSSRERAALMARLHTAPDPGDPARKGFAWLAPPILNPTTRVVCEMTPAGGLLRAQGWEADGPATAVMVL